MFLDFSVLLLTSYKMCYSDLPLLQAWYLREGVLLLGDK